MVKSKKATKKRVEPPVAAREVSDVKVQHGVALVDEYAWLANRKDPRVIPHLKAENAYFKQWAKDHKVDVAQKKIFKEMKSRISPTVDTAPYLSNGWMYQSRYLEGKEYPLKVRFKAGAPQDSVVLMDVNKLAKGKACCLFSGVSMAPNNKIFSYAVDFTGSNIRDIHFVDAETLKPLKDVLTVTGSAQTWAADSRHFFYVKKDPKLNRTTTVMRHVIGTKQSADVAVYHEADIRFDVWVSKSMSDKYIFICSEETNRSECWFIPSDDPTAAPRIFAPRAADDEHHEYSVDHWEDDFLVLTNLAEDSKSECENFRLARVPLSSPSHDFSAWKTIRAHDPEFYLESIEPFKKFIVVYGRTKGMAALQVMFLDDPSKNHSLDFGDEKCYDCGLHVNAEYTATVARYSIDSMTTPETIYDYDPVARTQVMVKRMDVPCYDPSLYASERLEVLSRDGKAKIPVSVCYRKDAYKKDGTANIYLNGYGAYGVNQDPYFSRTRASLLDRGVLFVIAHIRGSSTLGKHWYIDGRMQKKINSFNDFNDVAAFLLRENYGREIVCSGASAGGLLVCASVHMEPELYVGVMADVPFVDVVRCMSKPDAALTAGEWNEWGNPITSVQDFDNMLSYDPYQNVGKKPYPLIFLVGAYNDKQVDYSEPVKIAQRYRYYSSGGNEVLLFVELEKGHYGTSGRYSAYKDYAREFAVALACFSK